MARSIRPFDSDAMRAQGVTPGWVLDEDGLLQHPRLGVRLARVLLLEGERILYDHVLRAERGGGVFLPVDTAGRIGLQPTWRPQTQDQEHYAAAYPSIDLSTLGRLSYEVPRGFSDRHEPGSRTAVREAEEETRGRVLETHPLGPLCDNTSGSPHLTTAVWGRTDVPTADTVDPMEGILGRLTFFDRQGLATLQSAGTLYDGFTLAALALLWIQHPTLFMG